MTLNYAAKNHFSKVKLKKYFELLSMATDLRVRFK